MGMDHPPEPPSEESRSSFSMDALPASKLTPARGRSRSGTSLLLPSPEHTKGWWTAIAVFFVVGITVGIGLFAWYWFMGYVTTYAGQGTPGYRDGSSSQMALYNPQGLAMTKDGSLLIADMANHRIRKIERGGLASTIAGTGVNGYHNAQSHLAQFDSPRGITTNAKGDIFIADTNNHCIRKIDANGQVTTFAGTGIPGRNEGHRLRARFRAPEAIIFDKAGTLFVADTGNHLIRKIDANGQVTTFVGSLPGFQNGVGRNARFHEPAALAWHPNGQLLVADRENHLIRAIAPTGDSTTYAGSGQAGSRNGPRDFASFNHPSGLVVTKSGVVYVTDEHNHQIRQIDPNKVTTLAGTGDAGNRNGPPTWAKFTWPRSLVLDANGNLLVADWGNDSIRKISIKLLR
jgi:sugar lactone lactonase YvrE